MQLGHHPAPGLGEMLPGWYDVPQNPIKAATQGVRYTQGIGEIIGAVYSVPQNPVKDFMKGEVRALGTQGVGDCGCGCGGGGGCGSKGKINGIGVNGLGTITDDWNKIQADMSAGSYTTILTDTVFGVPMWAGLAAVTLMMFIGGDKHSYVGRGRRAARAAASAW